MSTYTIKLQTVYSQTVETPEGVNLPQGWSLSWHQAQTLKALRDPNIDVVFNTAMTGDGKSLAAYLQSMTGKTYTMAMYPTNELARDQERQVQEYKQLFKPKYDPQIYRLNGATLADFVETHKLPSKQQGIIDRVNNSEILITNPDIFHYIHDFRYLRRNSKKSSQGDNADKLFRKIDDSYNLFIFDEFHVFSSPQVASVLNALLLIKHTATPRKFLFLSATPNELLQDFLLRSELRYKIIDPVGAKAYRFTDANDTGQWRPISQPITLKFAGNLEPKAKSGYDWILENAESVILKFFLDHPGSKGAIILNSIASVYKLLANLKPLFAAQGLQVLPNTSLTGETGRVQSIADADLVIGTATIDVGVDFKINFLVFEAADSVNFIQRFGRLGRHKGFSVYQAYALIPNFLVARLFAGETPQLQDGMECDRVSFTQSIRDSWSFVNDFKGYPKRWGGIQSACMHMELRKSPMKETYPEAKDGFKADVQNAFGININQQYARIKDFLDTNRKAVIDEARSFRGSSQLDCAIYDVSTPNESERERFKTYNLPGLLSNFVIEPMEPDIFLAQVKSTGLPKQRFEQALCYLKLKGYREVRENWHFYHSGNVSELARLGTVQVLKGLEVTMGENMLSKALYRRGLVLCHSSNDG